MLQAIRNLTPTQWIILGISTAGFLNASTAQLTEWFGPKVAHDIISGLGFAQGLIGCWVMALSGQGSIVKQVLAMPGVQHIEVNADASATLAQIAVDKNVDKIAPAPAVQAKVEQIARVGVLLAAFLLPLLLFSPSMAQGVVRAKAAASPKLTGDLVKDIQAANNQVKATVTGQPADPTAALPCMDISVLTKLTPQNLVPTLKNCEQDGVKQLVSDTQRALDSAKAFTGSATSTTAAGDNDAINCLSPGLALFKAGMIIPAVPDTPAVLNPDGSVKTAAIPGTPEIDPGPILLYQKYREFTIVGGLTSCQTWFNGPINATNAAGIGAAGAVAGAAALLPK